MSELGAPATTPPRVVGELRAQLAAVTLLTRLPLGRTAVHEADRLAVAGPAFPIIGAGIGATFGGIASGLAGPLTPLLAVAVALAFSAALTGALHLDAIVDTADALGANSRERALAIMRDHAIGAYGAVALGLDLLIKAAALTALVHHGEALRFAIVAGVLSRSAPVALAASLPYARAEPGVGAVLTRSTRWRTSLTLVIALGIAVAVAGTDGAVLAACAVAINAVLWLSFRSWLGGVTGDTLGASVELCELAVLVAAVALRGGG